MAEPSDTSRTCGGCLEREQQIAALEARIAELEASAAKREARVTDLERRLDQATRSSKRQAAPFSKGPPKAKPRKPGRKPGKDYGQASRRAVPSAEQIDETHEAALPDRCPCCGGSVHETHVATQYQVEVPRKPIHRKFNVHVGRCTGCGTRVQGRHELQTSDALGAASSQLGPDLQAWIVQLNKELGLSHGKIQRLLKTMFGIEISRGGVVHAILRAARRCKPAYDTLIETMRRQPMVTPDETGWRIGGLQAWLHAFAAEEMTCYVIDRKRDASVAERVLGMDYAGVMVHDGWSPYDKFESALHQQCMSHLLRRCVEMIEAAVSGSAKRFPTQIKQLIQSAFRLRDRHAAGEVGERGLAVSRGRLNKRLDRLLKWTRANAANERLAKHLDKHRDQLLTFLYMPGVDATNYKGEQAIRLPATNRKVWGGNRTDVGALAQSILMSCLRTAWQQGRDALALLSAHLRTPVPRLVLVPA